MATQLNRFDVGIVGNGAIGKTAALALSQAGFKVALIGASSNSTNSANGARLSENWDVRVFALNHVAFNLLDKLKVWGALDASRIAPVSDMAVFDAAEKADGELEFDAYGAYIEQLAWIVEDQNIGQALDAALRFASNIEVITGQLQVLEVTADAAVLELSGGRRVEVGLVIGADGAQSWVRNQCDIGLDYRAYGQRGIVTNFACEKPHHGVARQWFVQEQGIIALLPLPENRVSLVWSAPDDLADQILREPLDALVQRLHPFVSSSLGKLTPLLPEDIKAFKLQLIKPHSMIADRVALMGDAAHVVHPLAGHGMNLGFGDVAALMKLLPEAQSGLDGRADLGDARLLARYQRSRREEVLLMQLTTDTLARLFGSDLEPLRFARSLGMNLLNRLPMLKRQLIRHAMGK
jgi:ubiquinone biosynthesis UbiH/UbiF/VisC/COQ6 family hydroxylase